MRALAVFISVVLEIVAPQFLAVFEHVFTRLSISPKKQFCMAVPFKKFFIFFGLCQFSFVFVFKRTKYYLLQF